VSDKRPIAECPACKAKVNTRMPKGGDGTALTISPHRPGKRTMQGLPLTMACEGSFGMVDVWKTT
jgi:hypothetical protein